MHEPPAIHWSIPQRLLGALIVWQLIYIPAANLLDFFPHREIGRDEVTDFREVPRELLRPAPVVNRLSAATDGWAQLTGQYQMWWLFAPHFPPQATFPAVELRWADKPPVQLRSIFDPENPDSYCRLSGSNDRLFQYEVHLGLGLVYWDKAEALPEAEAWRDLFRSAVSRQSKSIRAYLRWRLHQYAAEHPNEPPPSEVVLFMRIYRTPGAGEKATAAVEQPFARWFPAAEESSAFLPIEAYDPFADQFVRLPIGGANLPIARAGSDR